MQHCAHNTQAQPLHKRVCGSSTRASPANAPAERHLHVHSDAQQHARPCLPLLSTHCFATFLPSSSSSSNRLFSGIGTPNMPAIAADVRRADASSHVRYRCLLLEAPANCMRSPLTPSLFPSLDAGRFEGAWNHTKTVMTKREHAAKREDQDLADEEQRKLWSFYYGGSSYYSGGGSSSSYSAYSSITAGNPFDDDPNICGGVVGG